MTQIGVLAGNPRPASALGVPGDGPVVDAATPATVFSEPDTIKAAPQALVQR
jgi:hypothetical protein